MSLTVAGEIRIDSRAAREEVAGTAESLRALGDSARETSGALTPIAETAGAVGRMMADAGDEAGEWAEMIQMLRTSVQPLVGEMAALQDAHRELAALEAVGAQLAGSGDGA